MFLCDSRTGPPANANGGIHNTAAVLCTQMSGRTPLHYAVETLEDMSEIVERIIAAGADIEAKDV